ncbi:alkylhydroperoxidase family enzyme [Streptosporangium album]|uniref:Alkylhydroperoxidase family enzyme n=1 Tax=Streptosporangium album TaxID=47479 RepID=A0A7W7S2P3_9ACTN|nr:hypothetical protein [Streptosporangium album]MBB4942829.1 alkylhydroperoxidase family enzyme [Streptosporangium album]
MTKGKTSVSIAPWILEAVRKHAEANGLSVSTVLERGALREIAATHSPTARAAVYGADASTTQEADEQIVTEDTTRAADERRSSEAA